MTKKIEMKTLAEQLKKMKEDRNTSLIQARVPKHLVESVGEIMEREVLTWSQVLKLSLGKFVEEMQKNK